MSTVSQARTDSKNLHEHFSNPGIRAQQDHGDAIRLKLKPSTSGSAQPSGVSGNFIEVRWITYSKFQLKYLKEH